MSDPGSGKTRDGFPVIRLGAASSPRPNGSARIPGDLDDENSGPPRQALLAVAVGIAIFVVPVAVVAALGGVEPSQAPAGQATLRVETSDSDPEPFRGSVTTSPSSSATSDAPSPMAASATTTAGDVSAPSGESPASVAPAATGSTSGAPAVNDQPEGSGTAPGTGTTIPPRTSTSTTTTPSTSTTTTPSTTTTTAPSTPTTTTAPPTAPPSISSFVAVSLGEARCGPEMGTSYELRWRVGDAEYVTLSGAGNSLPRGRLAAEGARVVCVPDGQTPAWTLTAMGPGGTTSGTASPS
jgi:hypothetical protein